MKRLEHTRPDVFGYVDYRLFLKDMLSHIRQRDPDFTVRGFSAAAGYASPSILKEVLDGKRNIPLKNFRRFVGPFGLGKREMRYLKELVCFNQAKTDAAKSRYFREIIRLQKEPRRSDITSDQYEFYNTWYYAVVRELTALKDFKNDPEWIAAHIRPAITLRQAREAVALLLRLGLLVEKPDGSLARNAAQLNVGADVMITAVKELARRSLEMEWEAVERVVPADREISGLTMHMSEACYRDVKEMVRTFKKQVLDYVSRHPEPSEVVGQLNVGLFPYTDMVHDREER